MLKYDIRNIRYLLLFLLRKRKEEIITQIEKIHSLTYREFVPQGGRGGGAAVLTCQKLLLKDSYKNIPLTYSFWEPNKYSKKKKNQLWCLWSSILFAFQKAGQEKNTVYITHDYCTAFGLYLLGKKYAVISHIQGARIEEKTNFGEKFSFLSKKIIQWCEKKAFQNAVYVCFPSNGAYDYFCQSPYKTFSSTSFKKGPILYNTLYAFPKSEKYPEVKKDSNKLTFLSIGQLSFAKGMDRHPSFFDSLLSKYNKPIRYIYVGQGPLFEKIKSDLDVLKQKYSNFEYIHVPFCSYQQIQYLQDICDVYLMLHRISIFDLSTLELMKKKKVIVLSQVWGNKDFDKKGNILFWNEKDNKSLINQLLTQNFKSVGELNYSVYNTYFSNQKFVESYHKLMDLLLFSSKNHDIIVDSQRKVKTY